MHLKKPFLLLLFTAFHFAGFTQETKPNKLLNTFHSISSHEILEFAEELSDEKYKGRLSGSPEYLQAARWCAGKFEDLGILPASNGSYFQYFPNAYSEVYSTGSFSYTAKGNKKINYTFPEDYFPGSNSASGTVSGELVYVGFGITAPELEYDDYENVDVKGKIVIMESGTPYTKNDSILEKWTPYAYHHYKLRNAVKQGAAGLLYVGKLANPNTVHLENFVYVHIDEKVAEQLFTDSGKNYSEVKKSLGEMKPVSFALNPNQVVNISAETKHFPDAESCNVVGMIEGVDPVLKNEVIIIGGHLDGQGYLGEVFPSALDNASGVADILGAAKALAKSEIRSKRSVLFILFGGEECGLYGSTHYVKDPLFPIEKTVMMINLDMVGNGTGFFVSNGKSFPELFDHFETANEKFLHRELAASEQRKNFGRPRSDASLFENAGINTFLLWTRNSVFPVYYHHPLDKTDVLTPEIMEDAAKLLYLGVLGVANDESL
ncbi:M28 family peptidase [Mariniphaga sp.]|uniref:M28 family peptidase n=1 Tax=Mariniphaga sp. TaxID=1954475 RepID=UPI0035665C91